MDWMVPTLASLPTGTPFWTLLRNFSSWVTPTNLLNLDNSGEIGEVFGEGPKF